MEEKELVVRAARGSLDAFTELIRPRLGALRSFCARLVADPNTGDDLAQDALLAAFQSLRTLERPEDFDVWLRGIARNKVRMALRRQAVRTSALEVLVREEEERWLSSVPKDDGLLDALRSCVAGLGENARRLLDLFYRDRRPAREAARTLGLTDGAFYTTLTRVRQALRKCVGQRMGEKWA